MRNKKRNSGATSLVMEKEDWVALIASVNPLDFPNVVAYMAAVREECLGRIRGILSENIRRKMYDLMAIHRADSFGFMQDPEVDLSSLATNSNSLSGKVLEWQVEYLL